MKGEGEEEWIVTGQSRGGLAEQGLVGVGKLTSFPCNWRLYFPVFTRLEEIGKRKERNDRLDAPVHKPMLLDETVNN